MNPSQFTLAVYREPRSCTTLCILETTTPSGSTQEPLITALLKCPETPPKIPPALFFSFYTAFFFSKYLSIFSINIKNSQLSFFFPQRYSSPGETCHVDAPVYFFFCGWEPNLAIPSSQVQLLTSSCLEDFQCNWMEEVEII